MPFFTNANLLKMDAWYEPCLEEYKKIVQLGLDYARWFEDFTRTDRGDDVVAEYNGDWRKMHDELFAFFNNEMLLGSNDEEGDPMLKLDVSQRDNYKWQFRAWMTGVKNTCPNWKLYFGHHYGIKEQLKYSRFFFKHHWDPEKTADESLMKTLYGSNWDKDYKFDYNAM